VLLAPKPGIVYGPVRSRRLGRSLGINLLPAGRKTCTFDCRYCQYGWAGPCSPAGLGDHPFPSVGEVVDALARTLSRLPEPPAFLTFSGNGEPTLHPSFGEIVDGVGRLRNRMAPEARLAILSNSSEVGRPEVREALGRLDVRIMKLDAGSQATLLAYNRPAPGVRFERILEGLAALPQVTIQTLFCEGPAGNLDPESLSPWFESVRLIHPQLVQIYSLDRQSPCPRLVKASTERLEAVRNGLAARGVVAEVA